MVAVVLVVEVVVAALVGVVLVALAHILEMHFVTCTVWWWWWWLPIHIYIHIIIQTGDDNASQLLASPFGSAN